MICKQHIVLNHVFFRYKSNLDPVTLSLEVSLKIPQLTLAQIAQLERHETAREVSTTVLGSRVQVLLEVAFFAEFIF